MRTFAFLVFLIFSFNAIADDVKVTQVAGCAATIRTTDKGSQTVMQCPDGTVTTNYPDGSTTVLQPSGQIVKIDPPK